MPKEENTSCSVGCGGCLFEIIGILGIIFIIMHWNEVWWFVTSYPLFR